MDVLRGFALLCILIVNWTTDTKWDNDAWEGFSGVADQAVWWTINILLNEKSRPMFTFLFGLGFALQMERADARGASFVAVYARRLAVLFLIGAAHDILTERDILWEYALFGFVLLPLRRLNPALLVVLALGIVLIPPLSTAPRYRDFVTRLTASNNARTEIKLDTPVLDTYLGEYELESEPYTIFVTRDGNALLVQSPGVPGGDDVPMRLVAESATQFFSRSVDAAQLSFTMASTGSVSAVVLHLGGRDVPGRVIHRGRPTTDDQALRRVASQDPHYRIYATGTFGQIVSMRARLVWQHISSYATNWQVWLSSDFALFLLGLYAGRRRLFHEVDKHRELFRGVMWCGLAIGLLGDAFVTLIRDSPPGAAYRGEPLAFTSWALTLPAAVLAAPMLGLAYVAALTLLLQQDAWKRRLSPFGNVGRMALTNYLLQSVAFVVLFFGYGLGWFGRVGPFNQMMLALPVFAIQIVVSQWWLRRFKFGPAEWIWRTLTYWKLQPMRIDGL